ncbi:MAG: hypothetical protein WKG01_34280 [Kofleriaceae bacterium]
MSTTRTPEAPSKSPTPAGSPQSSHEGAPAPDHDVVADPAGQSPDDPIDFASDTAVGRGNEERANAEPEPAALHDAETPGVPDVAQKRRDAAHHHDS